MEVGILVLAFYFLPTIIALAGSHHNAVAIGVLNLLLGWTLVGWVLALVWALAKPPQMIIVQQPQPTIPAAAPPTAVRNPAIPDAASTDRTAWIVTGFVILAVAGVAANAVWKSKRASSDSTVVEAGVKRDEPAPILPSALAAYTKEGFPKTFSTWGDSGVARLEALRKLAAEKAALNTSCDVVEVVEWSDLRSSPPAYPVIWVDCRNTTRLYYTESELR